MLCVHEAMLDCYDYVAYNKCMQCVSNSNVNAFTTYFEIVVNLLIVVCLYSYLFQI